jgi:hypothetical protein
MIRTVPALSALVLLAACATPPPVAPANPPFVDALAARLSAEPVANPPASIWRYDYAGRPVWYVPARCCDIPGVLYAADGTTVCEPDGGLTGRGDGRCPDFATARRNGIVVWSDPRAR